MKRGVVAMALLLLALAVPAAADAQAPDGRKAWKRSVGIWDVNYDAPTKTCFIVGWLGDVLLRVGYVPNTGEPYMFLHGLDWKWLEQGKTYKVVVHVSSSQPHKTIATAQRMLGMNVLLLAVHDLDTALIGELMRGKTMTLQVEDRPPETLDLKNIAAALAARDECGAANGEIITQTKTTDPDAKLAQRLWKTSGNWLILFEHGDCVLAKGSLGRTVMRAGYLRESGTYYVLWLNDLWDWAEPGKEHDVVLRFARAGKSNAKVLGMDMGEDKGIAIFGRDRGVFAPYRTDEEVTIEYRGREMGRVNLHGLDAALKELPACLLDNPPPGVPKFPLPGGGRR